MSEFPGMGMEDFLIRAEEEGQSDLVDTRQAKIGAIGNALDDIRPDMRMDEIDAIIEGQGIDIDSLTPEERREIDRHL